MDPGHKVSLGAALLAGFLSFVSPCILPLIPSYLSYLTGISLQDLSGENVARKVRFVTVIHSVMFILGFSIVFIAFGASATFLGQFLKNHKALLGQIGGALILLFGIHLSGIIKLKFLEAEKRVQLQNKPLGYFGSLLVGLVFAAGWTPCVGPILGSILIYAGTTGKVTSGILLLTAYSLGLGIPFFLASLAVNSFLGYLTRFRKFIRFVSVISGVFLMVVGLLLLTNRFSIITEYLSLWLPG